MATYYVIEQHPSASDSNAGTSASLPWLTLAKAVATATTAGDTIHVGGGGVYRETLTQGASGSSGSPIVWDFDVSGANTGYAGKIIITAHDDDTAVSTRASCIDLNNKTYVEYRGATCIGGTSFVVGNTANATATAYEGVVLNLITIPTSSTNGIKIELNAGTTPTGNGLHIVRSVVQGGIDIDWDSNGSANVNLKLLIDGCYINGFSTYGIEVVRVTNGGAFTVGGITVSNNTIFTGTSYGVYMSPLADTTNVSYVVNNLIFGATSYGIHGGTGTTAAIVARNNIVTGGTSTAVSACTEVSPNWVRVPVLLGGIHDADIYSAFGHSPYKQFEPFTISDMTNVAIDRGSNQYDQSADLHNNTRQLGRPSVYGNLFYFDGSDAAVSDPNSVWTNEANITDTSESTNGTVATTGSTSSNYVMAEGTSAPASGGTIVKVQARFLHDTPSGTADGEVKIYTDGLAENIGTISVSSTTADTWSSWTDLTAPTGGWNWTKVGALEFKAYRTSGTATWRIWMIQIGVITAESTPDIGAVEATTRPTQNTSDVFGTGDSAEFAGAGYQEFWRPVAASSTTITVNAQYDSNYTGTKPTLKVMNIPGVADQSDTMTSAANTTEALSVTFTPTAAGWVRVRLISSDTSASGKCFFDDLE